MTRNLLGYTLHTPDDVYRPDQDSTMLADAVDPKPGDVCLDLCTGTGLSALAMAEKAGRCLATDLDPRACRVARRNARENGLDVQVIQADLARGLATRFEAVSCNPPYLPTGPPEADVSTGRDVDGGQDGADLTRRVLDALPDLLTEDGRCWMNVSSLQPVDELRGRVERLGLSWTEVAEIDVGRFETLTTVEFARR